MPSTICLYIACSTELTGLLKTGDVLALKSNCKIPYSLVSALFSLNFKNLNILGIQCIIEKAPPYDAW